MNRKNIVDELKQPIYFRCKPRLLQKNEIYIRIGYLRTLLVQHSGQNLFTKNDKMLIKMKKSPIINFVLPITSKY